MQKLDWSKLEEMPAFAPTGPGRYVTRCGGVVEVEFKDHLWRMVGNKTYMTWQNPGWFCSTSGHPLDIVAPAPDVLPWESELKHQNLSELYESQYAALQEAVNQRMEMKAECERLRANIERREKCLTAMEGILHDSLPVKSEAKLQGFVEMLKEVIRVRDVECERLRSENVELQSWKESAMNVMNDIDLQAVGKELDVPLGNSISSSVLPGIRIIKAERNELHCENKTLEAEIRVLKSDVEQYRQNWLSLQSATGEQCLEKAIERVKEWREITEAAKQTAKEVREAMDATTPQAEPFKVGDVVVVLEKSNSYCEVGDVRMVKEMTSQECINLGGSSMCLASNHIRHATPAERRKFFAMNPTKHPSYRPEHGDMKGWRYFEIGEPIKEGDEHNTSRDSGGWIEALNWRTHCQQGAGLVYRRRVDSEGNDIAAKPEQPAKPEPQPWKPTPGDWVKTADDTKEYFIGIDESGYGVTSDGENYGGWDMCDLSPWIDLPYEYAEFTLNGDTFKAERWGSDQPVVTEIEKGGV